MRKITMSLLGIAAVMFVMTGTASAAPLAPAAICKAASKTSFVSKAHCHVVRRCSYFGCSYEQVCN
jgi:threonine aldolase